MWLRIRTIGGSCKHDGAADFLSSGATGVFSRRKQLHVVSYIKENVGIGCLK
jgi:hypothetical protein